ncbi:MAG: WYL domain-containing protein [Clostridia bacterium]|nr:WYL domain-containing protein [Clostridia bacterium]
MKTDNTIRVLIALLNNDIISADKLAAHLEMSKRSVYRYVDALNMAGVPIISYRGANGGFQIFNRYKMHYTFFSDTEYEALIAAISSSFLDSKTKTALSDKVLSIAKYTQSKASQVKDCIIVDVDNDNSMLLNTIKSAIIDEKCVSFGYLDANSVSSQRSVDPYYILYKNNTWYFIGRCHKNGFRSFKISSISDFEIMNESFKRQDYYYNTNIAMRGVRTNNAVEITMLIGKNDVCRINDICDFATPCGNRFLVHTVLPISRTLIQKLSTLEYIKILSPKSMSIALSDYSREIAKNLGL